MRNIILFIVVIVCVYVGYDKLGRHSVSPKIVAECTVQQRSEASGKDSLFVVIDGKEFFMTHVLNEKGMWVYPCKDSVVTAFVTVRNPNTHFMQGKVGAADIDKAFQQQIPRIILLMGFVGLVILIQYWQSDGDVLLPQEDKK